MVTLQYPNSDVVDVLRLYETLTGKKLIMDNFVQGKVNIFIAKPIPREEAIKIIEINLLLNKYSLVPAGGDLVKVIGTGQNPRGAGVPIISDEALIPVGDHVISFLFKLRFADPTELQQVLGQYLSPPQAYTSFLALPKSSSILVTENSSVIRSLVNIINQVDIPPAEVVSEFIKLERADASKVVDMLKEVFDKGNQPPGTPGAPGVRNVRPGVPVPPQAQPGQFEVDAGRWHDHAFGGFDRGRQDQDGGRCAHESHPRHHAPGEHAVCEAADLGVRRQCRIRQAGHAAVALCLGGGCIAGDRAGVDRAG